MGTKDSNSMEASQSQSRAFTFLDQVTMEDFKKTLECPICLETVTSPVVNCTAGHIICSLCRPRVVQCGLCGSPFTTSRNYAVEAILGLIEVKCRYLLCQIQLKADKLREHMDSCDYRPIACYEYCVAKCTGQLIAYEDYANHLMSVHRTRCKTSNEPEFQRINLSNALEVKWPIFLLSHKSKTFFLHRKSVSHNLMCWVSMMAPEREAVNNLFRLRIQHPSDQRKYMEWGVCANSVHTSLDDVQENGNCVFIPYEALTPYCERRVRHTTGQVFEFKWTMKILIVTPTPNADEPSKPQDAEMNTSCCNTSHYEFEVEEGAELSTKDDCNPSDPPLPPPDPDVEPFLG